MYLCIFTFFKLGLENIYRREWIEPFGIYDPSGELPPIPYGPAKGFFIDKYIFGFNIGYFEMSWIICSENKSSADQKHEIIQRFLHDYDKNIRDIVYTKKEADGALELFLDKEKICQIKNEKDFLKGYQHGIYA